MVGRSLANWFIYRISPFTNTNRFMPCPNINCECIKRFTYVTRRTTISLHSAFHPDGFNSAKKSFQKFSSIYIKLNKQKWVVLDF